MERSGARKSSVVGAGGVVFRADDKVLLLRHKEGTWVFPKGHIDPGEDALTAAIREVEEESGVRSHCPDPKQLERTQYVNRDGVAREIIWFLLCARHAHFTLSEKLFPEGGFFSAAEVQGRLSFAEDRDLFEAMHARYIALKTAAEAEPRT